MSEVSRKQEMAVIEQEKEEGATMIEYALLVVLIAIIAIAALRFLGQKVSGQFSSVGTEISGE